MAGRNWIGTAVVLLGLSGCETAEVPQWVSSSEVMALPEAARMQVVAELGKHCGTPIRPKLLGDDDISPERLRHGAELFRAHCAACHGVTGDGNGPVAAVMYPRPRDYRKGIFKFSSTPYGARPLRSDILRTIREGAKGTSMPSFKLLSDDELQALVDHVLVLTHRGELELLLALEADSDDEVNPDNVPNYIQDILASWVRAEDEVMLPVTPMPKYSAESVELGRQAFGTEAAGCFKCHGLDARGKTTENLAGFQDSWGFQTRAADLTSGMLHGGGRPEDIYRRIYGGISGTPMPSFKDKLASDPDTFWHLVHYVQYVSQERRRQVMEQVAREQGRSPAPSANGASQESSQGGRI